MMPRKRKREWPIRVLVYRAYPREIPQAMWDTAKRQRILWNNLTELWYGAADQARLLPDRKEPIWQSFDEWCRAAVAQSALDWVNGPDVLDRFRAATRAKKLPRFHRGLDRVAIAHRFTAGGVPLDRLIDNRRTKRFSLWSSATWEAPRSTHSPERKHWRAHIRIGSDTIDCALVLHRSLPKGAILKRVTWLGRRGGSKWFWYLALTVEEEPVIGQTVALVADGRPAAGLDLGWRLFGNGSKQDYLRIGMLVDSEQHMIELRLPLWFKPQRLRERRGLATIAKLAADASALVNSARALVEGMPEGLTLDTPRSGGRIGYRSLLRILQSLPPNETTAAPRQLLDEHDRIYRVIATLRFRLIQRRRWYYQNLAQWICARYQSIVIEDVWLPRLHRYVTGAIVHQNAAQYRNYAAVGELRAYLQHAARPAGCRIIEAAAANSTVTCFECGAKVESSADLILRCPNGHEWDQDKNAARNLLSQIDTRAHELGEASRVEGWKKLEFPAKLSMIAIKVPA
jgi:hypothetical protein